MGKRSAIRAWPVKATARRVNTRAQGIENTCARERALPIPLRRRGSGRRGLVASAQGRQHPVIAGATL